MAEWFSLLLLAFAVSLDSFGVGLTYGLRKMKLPFKSFLFIAFCSAASIFIAMAFGNAITNYVPEKAAESLGGIILIVIGSWALYQIFRQERYEREEDEKKEVLFNFEIKTLGLVIRILRKPTEADIDNSGTITGKEALLLGMALSLDAFGAGVGAALIGYSPVFMAASVALMSALFVNLGMTSGYRFSDSNFIQKFSFLPGVLLILLGIWNL